LCCRNANPANVNSSSGCSLPENWHWAEIKPVEPDQGNACAGKVRASLLSFPVFVNLAGPVRKPG
jgi:hypothetical protein